MSEEIPRELEQIATKFISEHLAMLDRNWLSDVLEPALAKLLNTTVRKHASKSGNTKLRAAAQTAIELVAHAQTYLPALRRCFCDSLNDGEHRQQPVCSTCALARIATVAKTALE